MEFARLTSHLATEGETLISTLEAMTLGKNNPTLDQRLCKTATHVGKTKATLTTKLDKRITLLAQRQPTNADWDNWFHYSAAYRRNQYNTESAFEITPSDRAQADLESAREIEAQIYEDSDDEGRTPATHSHKRKRQTSPGASTRQDYYRIPKKDRAQQRDYRRDPPSQTPANSRNQDFGRARPPKDHKLTYYNNQYPRPGSTGGRDNSSARNRDNYTPGNRDSSTSRNQSRPHTGRQGKNRDADTNRKIDDLQHQLDLLKRR